jgi:hypothetical protein
VFEVYLDSNHDHLTASNFRISPAGAIRETALGADGSADNSWDPVWDAHATVDSLGWSAAFRIPLSQLHYNSVSDATWGVQFGRRVHRKAEVSVFSFTPKSERGGVHRYGHLVGLGAMRAHRQLELLPYTSGRMEYFHVAPGNPFRDGSDPFGAAGVDLKYGVTSDLTLNATVNPDFGQVEVDPAVVNLSAFETFFDEKRPFFVEGADKFRFGSSRTYNSTGQLRIFHSRRVGRAPQRGLGGPGFSFVEAPTQTTILGAAKLTGRTRGGWSVASLDAVTGREFADYLDASAVGQSAEVEPRSNYFVTRLRRDLRQGATQIGGIVTAVNRDLREPAISRLLRQRAIVGGFDVNHAWGNRRWAFDGSLSGSTIQGSTNAIALAQRSSARYYQRPDAAYLRYDPARTRLDGYQADASLVKLAGLHWTSSLTYQSSSPGYEVNDFGFQNRVDRRTLSELIQYRENKPKYLQNWDLFAYTNQGWDFGGDLTFNQYALAGDMTMKNFWGGGGSVQWHPSTIDDRLTRGGPLGRIPAGGSGSMYMFTDSRKRTTVNFDYGYSWNNFGGWGYFSDLSISTHPKTQVQFSIGPSISRTHAIAQYVTTSADPLATGTYGNRFVFSGLDQTTVSFSTRLNWTFAPRLSLQLYAQPLVSAGDYHDFKEFIAPRELQFAVYGRDQGTVVTDPSGNVTVDPDGAGPAPAILLGNPDFNFRSLLGNAVLRWEYRAGSTLFFVWQQSRRGLDLNGEFDFGRDYNALIHQSPENVYAIKATWWISV